MFYFPLVISRACLDSAAVLPHFLGRKNLTVQLEISPKKSKKNLVALEKHTGEI